MGFRGDLVQPLEAVFGKFINISMATAIARTFIEDGFLMAADGRVRESKTKRIVTDEARKIFSFREGLAFAFTGQIELTPEESGDVIFRFIDQMKYAVDSISPRGYRTLDEYANELGKLVLRNLRAIKDAELPSEPSVYPGEIGSTIATVLMDGYYERRPSRVDLRFFAEETIASFQVIPSRLNPGKPLLYGYPIIGELLTQSDDRFVRYLENLARSLFPSDELWKLACFSASYIKACSGPEAVAMDDLCGGIGGHIHMASITPSRGFDWVPGFEPTVE